MKTLSAAEIAERHNASLPPKNHNQSGQLQAYVERFQHLAEQQEELREDTKELAKEAKGNGFDVAALKAIVKRNMETADQRSKRETKETVLDTYKNSLGMLD